MTRQKRPSRRQDRTGQEKLSEGKAKQSKARQDKRIEDEAKYKNEMKLGRRRQNETREAVCIRFLLNVGTSRLRQNRTEQDN